MPQIRAAFASAPALTMMFIGTDEQIQQSGYLAEWVGQQVTEKYAIKIDYTTQTSSSLSRLDFNYDKTNLLRCPLTDLSSPEKIEAIVDSVAQKYSVFLQQVQAGLQEQAAQQQKLAILQEENRRVLPPEFYRLHLKGEKKFPASLFPGEPGQVVSIERAREIVRDLVLQKLQQKGIPQNQFTEAIYTGAFTPDLDDIRITWESLGRPSGSYVIANRHRFERDIKGLIDLGYIEIPGFDSSTMSKRNITDRHLSMVTPQMIDNVPEDALFRIVGVYRMERWAQLFGKLDPNKRYVSIVKGQKKVLTRAEIEDRNNHFSPEAYLGKKDYALIQAMRLENM